MAHYTNHKSYLSGFHSVLVSEINKWVHQHEEGDTICVFSKIYVHNKSRVQLICREKTDINCFSMCPLTSSRVPAQSHWHYLGSDLSFSYLPGLGKLPVSSRIMSSNSSRITKDSGLENGEKTRNFLWSAAIVSILQNMSKSCQDVENQC